MDDAAATFTTSTGKKRIPKACGSCRFSKVRCDGGRPCSRCRNLNKVCVFVEKPVDPQEEKIENLEREVFALKQRLDDQQNNLPTVLSTQDTATLNQPALNPPDRAISLTHTSPETHSSPGTHRTKRKRSQFEVEVALVPNFVAKGVITLEQAQLFFGAFFQGCDRYVPIFEPQHDTFDSISSRSPLLFNAIITIGCGVLSDADSQICHLLNAHLRKSLNLVIVSPDLASLETVQALLVTACYVSERSLLLAFATRMALDLQLPDAYEDLRRRLVSRNSLREGRDAPGHDEVDAALMRRARAWFQLMVLEQILHVDAGNLRSFQLKGDARRCRILLGKSFTNILDLRLLSQVELNALRGKVHDSISEIDRFDEDEIMDILHDVQVDIDVWYNDWKNIMQASPTAETPILLVNLEVQKYWSQTIALCRAIRALGHHDIATMSPVQQDLLHMAKDALQRHLRIILDRPQHYLSKFCYAMDFVWAKCAFCFLLLLKLTRLLPDADESPRRLLLEDGNKLLKELNKAGGGWTSGGRTTTSRMYLQVLQQSIQKYGRALESEYATSVQNDINQINIGQDSQSPLNYFWAAGGNGAANEIDSFIPEQFVTEWDFPGLEFSANGPVIGDGFFDEFMIGNAFNDTTFPSMLA